MKIPKGIKLFQNEKNAKQQEKYKDVEARAAWSWSSRLKSHLVKLDEVETRLLKTIDPTNENYKL